MCFCDPRCRTPNCGSSRCLELCQQQHPQQPNCRFCQNYSCSDHGPVYGSNNYSNTNTISVADVAVAKKDISSQKH